MLKFTGHPLVDVGAATIAAFGSKPTPEDVEETDLQVIADYMTDTYTKQPMQSFLTVVFMNSGFVQGSYTLEKRLEYAKEVLQAYKNSATEENGRCVFFPDQISHFRAERKHLPLVTRSTSINFHPSGDPGLPVSGLAMLCIHALPLGCAKVGGKLLAVHSDNPEIMIKFARNFLHENLKKIQLAQQEGDAGLPEYKVSAKTALIETIVEIEAERQEKREDLQAYSVTAYHLSNSGQSNPLDARNPPLEIYQLPMDIVTFLGAIVSVTYRSAWQAISKRGWLLPKAAKANAKTASQTIEDERPKRNFMYEDLFRLPQDANQFVRRYFLRVPLRHTFAEDPRRAYSLKDEASLVSWQITDLFLRTVIHMDKKRIEQIRNMGDRLAEYVNSENDQKFFATFYAERKSYEIVRNAIIRVSNALVKQGKPPLVKFDSYIEVFEMPDDRGRSDWRFARDLILIRLIERLYELKWIENNSDIVNAAENAAAEQESTPTNN